MPRDDQTVKLPPIIVTPTPVSLRPKMVSMVIQAKSTMYSTPILCLILFLMISFSVPYASAQNTLTAYQVLQEYDFPVGLLPNGVLGYELDSSTGKFKLFLNGTCTFKIQSYELKYKSTISGVIAKDKLSSLSGISVKVLILWLKIVTVTRDEDELQFSVGIASADFPVSNFYESPTCGCGFDCVKGIGGTTNLNLNHFNLFHLLQI